MSIRAAALQSGFSLRPDAPGKSQKIIRKEFQVF
jgi:hypothetical protein